MNYKIKVTPEQSRKIQEICFEMGVEWEDSGAIIVHTEEPYLYVYLDERVICYGSNRYIYDQHKNTEISAEEFIKKYGKEKVKDFYNLEVNDVLVDVVGNERCVLAVLNRNEEFLDRTTYLLSSISDFDEYGSIWTVGELRKEDFTIKGQEPEEEIIEMTLEEVAELKGIDVKKLRIKE